MDEETGELAGRDCETGEWLPYIPECDSETGESENSATMPQRTKFRINNYHGNRHCCQKPLTRDMSPALLFLLPTLFFYPGLATLIIALLEVTIHMWAHKKNKTLTNKSVYYKSPMHIVASEFCAKCRDERTMDKVGKLQDKRAHRFKCHYEYVKRIVT